MSRPVSQESFPSLVYKYLCEKFTEQDTFSSLDIKTYVKTLGSVQLPTQILHNIADRGLIEKTEDVIHPLHGGRTIPVYRLVHVPHEYYFKALDQVLNNITRHRLESHHE